MTIDPDVLLPLFTAIALPISFYLGRIGRARATFGIGSIALFAIAASVWFGTKQPDRVIGSDVDGQISQMFALIGGGWMLFLLGGYLIGRAVTRRQERPTATVTELASPKRSSRKAA